jgi:hypothetical protein
MSLTTTFAITKIHGKYYDLGEFKHKGGLSVSKTFGKDATEHIKLMHQLVSPEVFNETLAKYEITDPRILENLLDSDGIITTLSEPAGQSHLSGGQDVSPCDPPEAGRPDVQG